MARKKGKKPTEDPTLKSLDELAAYAEKSGLPGGALEDELWDACYSDAQLQHEDVCNQPLYEQLEFLYARGYGLVRLREIVDELAKGE